MEAAFCVTPTPIERQALASQRMFEIGAATAASELGGQTKQWSVPLVAMSAFGASQPFG